MADIDQILAGGAGSSSRADFSGLFSGPVDAYYAAKDQKAKNELRDAFKNGVPTTADGQPDFGAMAKTLFQKGGSSEGTALIGASIGPTERAKLDSVDSPQQSQPIVGPSTSRNTVTIDPSKRADTTTSPQAPQAPAQQPTVMSVLAAQGIPNDQLQAASDSVARQLGVHPTAPLNVQDPQVRNVLVPAVQQLKRMGLGQVQPQQPGDNAPQPAPQAAPQDDQILKRLTSLAASPDKATAAAAQTRLKSYLAAKEPTNDIKNANASGMTLPQYQEKQGELATQQAGATEQAKAYVVKYNNIDEAGTRAIQEIPKLQVALKQMESPDFYSGIGSNYNLALKRVAVSLGGDPDKAAPQEIVGKVIADSVLNGLGALKGLGPIRVAEMNLATKAAMSPDNSIQTNKFLANVAIRVQQRAVEVSDAAQNYNGGVLDVGFDKQIRKLDKEHPLFTAEEVSRFQRIIDGKEKQAGQAAASAGQKFNSPADVHAAVAAGKLKKGDTFVDGNGVSRLVP